MPTFKAEVFAHQMRKDGTYNIKIRVTQNGRKKYLSTPFYATKADLTRSLALKNRAHINGTEDIIRAFRDKCDAIGWGIRDWSVEKVVDYITRKDEVGDIDAFAYIERNITEMMRSGRKGTANNYLSMLRKLRMFSDRTELPFSMITKKFLADFAAWLVENRRITSMDTGGEFGQKQHIARLHHIYMKAKGEYNNEEEDVIRIKGDPFKGLALTKRTANRKRAISREDLLRIIHLSSPDEGSRGSVRYMVRDVYLLSFYLLGMNAIDLYYATDYREGRITYERMKTRDRRQDRALISVLIPPEAVDLVEKYRDPRGERVFMFYRRYSSYESFAHAVNIHMRALSQELGIEGLTFYSARHTWATIAANDAGVDKYRVHEALNHAVPMMSVTDAYIRRSWDGIDRANRAVLDYVFGE